LPIYQETAASILAPLLASNLTVMKWIFELAKAGRKESFD
jgi:hypothetical protein